MKTHLAILIRDDREYPEPEVLIASSTPLLPSDIYEAASQALSDEYSPEDVIDFDLYLDQTPIPFMELYHDAEPVGRIWIITKETT